MKLSLFGRRDYPSGQLALIPERRRGQREEPKVGGKKAIFILLLGSLFLAVAFWLWGSFTGRSPQEKVSTTLVTATPTRGEEEKKAVVAKVLEKTKTLRGDYGFYVYNLVDRDDYGAGEKQVFPAASLIKLPVILALYQEAEAGRIDLEEKYKLKNEDKLTGTGSLAGKPAGTILTYRELAHLMCRDSDNTAFNVVRKRLGEEKIEGVIKSLGMEQTSLERNETTPYDIGLFLKKLYTGSLISRKSRDEIIDYLTNTSFEDRIPAGVPEGVKVSHKIGTETGAYSDAGIVFSSKPFILVVLSKNASPNQATPAIAEIARLVFEAETN